MAEQFDVIVIGSGAGGAPVAHVLAKAGRSVLVLEKGPFIVPQYQARETVSEFKRDELISDGTEKRINIPFVKNDGDGYYSSHVEPDLNDEPHVYLGGDNQDRATIEGYTAQVVGGGTQLYGGVSFRFTDTDLRLRSFNEQRGDIRDDPAGDVKREARDWPISYDQLEPYYAKAEELVGINGTQENQLKKFSRNTYQPPLTPNEISQYAFEGMSYLGAQLGTRLGTPAAKPYRTPLAVITRDHAPSGRKVPKDPETARTSYVNRYGDPLGLKSNTWVSLLSPVKDLPNFQIRCNCVVTTVRSSGNKVTQVDYLDPSGYPRSASAKMIVVACSAIESVRLLLLSAREDANNFGKRIHSSGLLGSYFLTHCFGGARAIVPGRFDKSRALDADWAIDACATEAYLKSMGLWAGGGIYNNTSDQALPLSLFRTHGSQDLDSLWKGFVNDQRIKCDGITQFLDDEFGRGLSISFMANQVPQRAARAREGQVGAPGCLRDQDLASPRRLLDEHARPRVRQRAALRLRQADAQLPGARVWCGVHG